MELKGFRCTNCKIEWNSSIKHCPRCGTDRTLLLNHTVPYAPMSEIEPNRHECICGCIFYKKPKAFLLDDHFEILRFKEQIKVECPNCGRCNIDGDKIWFTMPVTIPKNYQFGEG